MDNSDLYKIWYVVMKAIEYGPLKKRYYTPRPNIRKEYSSSPYQI